MPLESVNASDLAKPHGYSHAVVGTGSRIIQLSGQVSVDQDGNLVGEGDLAAQVERAMLNLASALTATGAGIGDLAKLNIYVVDYSAEKEQALFSGFAAAAKRTGMGRTSTVLLGVSALGVPGALVEVDGMAIAS